MTFRTSLPFLDTDTDNARAAALLADAKAKFGFVPNMYRAMANAPGLLATYLFASGRFREESNFSPVEQEIIVLSVSFENDCAYCVAAHSTIADRFSKVPKEVTDALRAGHPLPDTKLQALSSFTRTMVAKRGWVGDEDARAFLAVGYGEAHILEIILGIAFKTISNYTNHLFGTPLDEAFKGRAWQKPSA